MEISVSKGKSSLTLKADESERIPYSDLVLDLERSVIGGLLSRFEGVKARVADYLTMNRTTLVEKSRRHGFPLNK